MPTYLWHGMWLCLIVRSTEEAALDEREGLTNEGRHHLLLLYKQALDKRFTESLHLYIPRARTNRVRWACFQEKYHNSQQ